MDFYYRCPTLKMSSDVGYLLVAKVDERSTRRSHIWLHRGYHVKSRARFIDEIF